MDRLPQMSVDAYIERMRASFERVMRQVGEAVNAAATGRVITDSEERVHDLMGDFRAEVYQTAIQMRIEAAEASFSPSGPHRPAPARQGTQRAQPAVDQRGHAAGSPPLSQRR